VIIYLVRHAQPVDAAGRCYGHTDLELAEAGRGAVHRLAASWTEPPTRVVASDLVRARDTAALLAVGWQREVRHDARLREMHFGAWDGRYWDALQAEDGDRVSAWMQEWSTARAPEGEALPDVAARVAAWWEEERATLAADDSVAVVAHAGSLQALLCHLLPLSLDRAFQLRIDYARVTALSLGGRRTELLYANADRIPGSPG
jgi:alpha-ribazole phosphatase